jgi:hypothetical protein
MQRAAHVARGQIIDSIVRQLPDARIVLLDGAMGTTIQRYKLDEAGDRRERFKICRGTLRGLGRLPKRRSVHEG